MTFIEPFTDVPVSVRYNRRAIDEIITSIEEGTYCAVLGPRLCGKTVLLRYLEQLFRNKFGWYVIYIDLHEMIASTQRGFFADLMQITSDSLTQSADVELILPDMEFASSAVFRGFITDTVDHLGKDIVLIIEHLEAIPTDLVQALLTSLRAAYMDQQTTDYQLKVVVSGALSLATLTFGESSPFRGIARRVFVGDLSEEDTISLITEYLTQYGISVTRPALEHLVKSTNGDNYLIRVICERCAHLTNGDGFNSLQKDNVKKITDQFLENEVFQYAPLLEAIQLIEEDPDLLHCVVTLLDERVIHKSKLPLPLSPDLDPLYLTGVVELIDGENYRVQNSIYRNFMQHYFRPGRVGRSLAMAGRWDEALDYLQEAINQGDETAQLDLMSAILNAIYASDDLEQAAHFLIRGLLAGFDVLEAQVWILSLRENMLRLVGSLGTDIEAPLLVDPHISTTDDRLEARAYRRMATMRGQESERGIKRAIPLFVPGRNLLGVVSLCESFAIKRFAEQRERDRQLNGFLSQAARAMHTISTRRQELALAGSMQTSLMIETPPQVTGWQLAARLDPRRETSGDFYDFISLPGGRIGIVIADVADKGMGAALYMTLSRTLIRTYAPDNIDRPDITMRTVNERILADTHAGLFVTVFYGILDPVKGRLIYCNAGHNPPFILHKEQQEMPLILHRTGMALGVTYDARWEPQVVDIPEEGLMILYTDGVVDAQNPNGDLFGDTRLLEAASTNYFRSAQDILDAMITGVRTFAGENGQFDDMAMVVLRREVKVPIPEKPVPTGRRVF